jgi:hypothetical protein
LDPLDPIDTKQPHALFDVVQQQALRQLPLRQLLQLEVLYDLLQ